MTDALKPCPFCGSTLIDPAFWTTADYCGPGCDDCGATAETSEKWNARVVPVQSAPPILTTRTSGERPPSSDAAVGGADTDILSRAELVRYFRTEEYADEIADIIDNFPPAEATALSSQDGATP